MQCVQESVISASANSTLANNSAANSSGMDKSTVEGVDLKKSRSQPRDTECRVPRVPSTHQGSGASSASNTGSASGSADTVDQTPLSPNQTGDEGGFQVQPTIVADKYLLLDQVEGSSLVRCVDVNTQEELVCKVVPRDSHALISAHYRLDSHARVAALHEVLVGSRYLYLVFARAHGDLHSYVRCRKRLRESEARRLFRQIAETVQVCHRNGIVLRDLKLRKFVFADEQKTELKLESLEDAVLLEEPESDWLHDKRGCPAYVSPEILKVGAQYSGKAADMWSLGVILYTMLVGRYPFNDSEHASLFAKICRGHFVIPECLSARARCLIRSLMRREPSERLTSEDIFHHPWLARDEDHRDWQHSSPSSSSRSSLDQLVPECSFYDD